MADCRDCTTFCSELKRMCDTFDNCNECLLHALNNARPSCHKFLVELPEVLEVVQKWSDENPQETRMSKFLKFSPNAQMTNKEKYPSVCAKAVYGLPYEECDKHKDCFECWNTPI